MNTHARTHTHAAVGQIHQVGSVICGRRTHLYESATEGGVFVMSAAAQARGGLDDLAAGAQAGQGHSLLAALLVVGHWLWRDWAIDESGVGLADALFLSQMREACRLPPGAAADAAARGVLRRCVVCGWQVLLWCAAQGANALRGPWNQAVLFGVRGVFDVVGRRTLLRSATASERAAREPRTEELQALQRSIVASLRQEHASRRRFAVPAVAAAAQNGDGSAPPLKKTRVSHGGDQENADDACLNDDCVGGVAASVQSEGASSSRVLLHFVMDVHGAREPHQPDHWTDILHALQTQNCELRARLETLEQTSRSRLQVLQQQLFDGQAQLARLKALLMALAKQIDGD